MCAAILTKGFLPGSKSSFAKQIRDVGHTLDWIEISGELCGRPAISERFISYVAEKYLRILYIQCYARLSEMAAVVYVSETIPLLDFCGIEYDEDIDANEYLEFCDLLREKGMFDEFVNKFDLTITTGGKDIDWGDDPTSLDRITTNYSYRMEARSLLQFLEKQIDLVEARSIGDREFGFAGHKVNIERGTTKKGPHEIRTLKFTIEFKTPEDYINKLVTLEKEHEINLLKRHSPEYLFNLARYTNGDAGYAKNLNIVACWLQVGGNIGRTIELYAKKFNKVEISEALVSNVSRVYRYSGLIGLHNIERSMKAISNGIPIYWQEFYYAMLVICKHQTYEIERGLLDLRMRLDGQPDLVKKIDALLKQFTYLMNATLVTEEGYP